MPGKNEMVMSNSQAWKRTGHITRSEYIQTITIPHTRVLIVSSVDMLPSFGHLLFMSFISRVWGASS